MSDRFFADTWYRVAGLRLAIPGHVAVERHRYGAQAWYVLLDRLSGRVHRLTPTSYLFAARLDGRRTVDAIWQDLVAELDADAPGQPAVVQLLMQLHGADLLAGDIPPDAIEILSRRERMARSVWMRNLRSPMSMQIPLLDPDRFLAATLPLVRPLLGPLGLVLWCVLVAAGVATAAQHWTELGENLLDRLLGAEGLLAMALCYPVLKVLHELGHGYVARRLGCEVREMGLMLLVLLPVPYVDVSASAALRSKWQRAAVAFAGIAVEAGLAAAAALVWAAAEPGLLRAVAFNVMVIGGFSTLVVNGNPLLRFDGYYVLSDLLEVPNLAGRAVQFWGNLANRHLLGVQGLRRFPATAWERAVFVAYAPAAYAYRISVSLGVALFVAAHYLAVGVALAAITLFTGLVWPVLRAFWRVATAPLYRRTRGRAVAVSFGGVAALLLAVLAVPAPVHTTAEGVVWLPEDAIVRAGTDGFVDLVAAPGAVTPGTPLVAMVHPVAQARLQVSAARVEELQARYAAEWVQDRIAAGVTAVELAQESASLERERVREGRLTAVAAGPGTFVPVRPGADMAGRYVKEGEVLGYVTPAGGEVARVVVPQADVALVQGRLRHVSVLMPDRRTAIRSSVLRALPAGLEELPHPALASGNGGGTVTDPRDTRAARAFERQFQFDVALPDAAATRAAGWGAKVLVRFDYAWEPLGDTIYRRVRQGLLSRFET